MLMNQEQREFIRNFIKKTTAEIESMVEDIANIQFQMEKLRLRLEQLEHKKTKPRKAKAKPAPYTEDELAAAREVLDKINEHAGTGLQFENRGRITGHVKEIIKRLRKGATVYEMRLIAWFKCPEFKQNEEQGDGPGIGYCKPTTLYSDAHFDDYLDAAAHARAVSENMPVSVARRGQGETLHVGDAIAKLEVV